MILENNIISVELAKVLGHILVYCTWLVCLIQVLKASQVFESVGILGNFDCYFIVKNQEINEYSTRK
jgi:hypothetical protein